MSDKFTVEINMRKNKPDSVLIGGNDKPLKFKTPGWFIGNMVKFEPNIIHNIHFDRPIEFMSIDDVGMSAVFNAASVVAKQVDEYIISFLYEEYKNTDVSELYVIDQELFRTFLLRHLPIFLKELNK